MNHFQIRTAELHYVQWDVQRHINLAQNSLKEKKKRLTVNPCRDAADKDLSVAGKEAESRRGWLSKDMLSKDISFLTQFCTSSSDSNMLLQKCWEWDKTALRGLYF